MDGNGGLKCPRKSLEKLAHAHVNILVQVKDVMKKKEELPLCQDGDMITDQLAELTSKGCGCLLVVDDRLRLIGTFTDGDLRRTLKAHGAAIFNLTVGEMCNR